MDICDCIIDYQIYVFCHEHYNFYWSNFIMGKAKIAALEHVNSISYIEDFYVSNDQIFCIICKNIINHTKNPYL
ncbi:3573_t:CDS:2 [Gigaspora margarita]|uniref:3573_t:CDS:1 n=1 Tax=Gigaspora margarita TaxID=4874 RepID=A0ABN7UJI8_GIGMA|nr:3573_t:CDS:2 [Gigaspora margarita]